MYLENRIFRILLIASPAHCMADQIDWVFDLALVEAIRYGNELASFPWSMHREKPFNRPRGDNAQRKRTG